VPPSKTATRLRRLLVVVPYVVRHPGSPLEELSRLFDVDPRQLATDLSMLLYTGLPPYTPGDLIEVDLEGEQVSIRMADYFSRPVRLTRAEALALYLRGTALLGTPGLAEADHLRSALEKLKERLGDTLGQLQVEPGGNGKPSGPLDAVRAAAERLERVEIDYFSQSRDELTTRRVDPEHVFSALGNWYLVAWCHLAGGERMFRVDRIRAVRPTGETFEPRGLAGQGRALYTVGGEDLRVRLRLLAGARWVAEYLQVEERREEPHAVEVVIPTKDLAWMAKLLLRVGPSAQILEPPELIELTHRAADETLARYRESST
jgi:proteasome accessory factor C